jgi:predicted nucleotidyltransferase
VSTQKMDTQEHIKQIIALLGEETKETDRIRAAYLFGSSAIGRSKTTSDIDIAFLVDQQSYTYDPVRAVSPAFMLATKIGMRLDKETDVTILNSASLEIAYEVITTGRCVYDSDPETRFEYESKIRGMYFDFRPFIEKLRAESMGYINPKGGN